MCHMLLDCDPIFRHVFLTKERLKGVVLDVLMTLHQFDVLLAFSSRLKIILIPYGFKMKNAIHILNSG